MRQISYRLTIILIWFFFGCSKTLEITEINGLNKMKLDSLIIQPDIELYDLRVDIIRQTYNEQIDDSTILTKDIPYHKLGFNLGNGIFFDLNENLSLRIDYLLNINALEDFKIEQSYSKNKMNRILLSREGDFKVNYTHRNKSYNIFKINRQNDSISIYYKNKYQYSVLKDDSTLIYMNSKRIIDKVQKKEENYFYQKFKKRVDEYKIIGRDIILNNNYKITLSKTGEILEVFKIGKKKDFLRYKIIRNEGKIYIYNDKYYGMKIVKNKDGFTLYHNDKFIYEIKNLQ